MKSYGEYKKTTYDWWPIVPAHWDHITIRSLMQTSDIRCGMRSDLELLSVYREYGVIKKNSRDDNHNKPSLDISNYKYVGRDFVVMNKMKMWQGSCTSAQSLIQNCVESLLHCRHTSGSGSPMYDLHLSRGPKI